MTIPTIADYRKCTNPRMAAEAFPFNDDGPQKQNVKQAPIDGNHHASCFTPTQAGALVDRQTVRTVVDQCTNIHTGLSGTPIRIDPTSEFVLALPSTAFTDAHWFMAGWASGDCYGRLLRSTARKCQKPPAVRRPAWVRRKRRFRQTRPLP